MRNRIKPLSEQEIRAILRAADEIIAQGGRTLLAKILKGSKDKKLLELGLDQNPSYGLFSTFSLDEVLEKVDHVIRSGYLEVEKRGKLPLIIFSPYGWAIERERRAEEFLQEWDHWLMNGIVPISMEYLKERNRGMIYLFLFKILCSGDKKYIPYLKLWERIDFKKVQVEIRHVIDALQRCEYLENSAWEQLKRERLESLLVPSKDPIILICQKCERPFVLDELNPEYYASGGIRFPELCPQCSHENH